MDRNQATGLILIAVMLITYWVFFRPEMPPPTETTTTEQVTQSDTKTTEDTVEVMPDSILRELNNQKYGAFSSLATGESKTISVETSDLIIDFSTQGGTVKEVTLKNFDANGHPVKLMTPESSEISWFITSLGREIDLSQLYYQGKQTTEGDTTILTFTAQLETGGSLSHIYRVPATGFIIPYQLALEGMDNLITKESLTYRWTNHMIAQEKSIQLSRENSTINYYTVAEDFDNLSERSTATEEEIVNDPLKWITIKQRFFLSGFIADQSFEKGRFATSVPASDDVVKNAEVTLSVAANDFKSGKGKFSYYFGPNDYHIIKEVAPDFSKNLYLGWPPMLWVNKYILIPLFDLLNNFLSNYGLIIIIMVLIIKLALSPLSYKSYVSMAKMKVLKPELDEIKEKHEGDMAKAQQEQMKLYQKVGVNPVSGCIPMVLQMPILLAMFYFFPQSIELRGESFLWAEDLSTYDSVLNLPFEIPFYGDHVSLFVLLMTISTILITYSQQQVSTVQGPMKAMSYMMPVIFLFVLNSYPAALSFYYFVSNLVTFGQQTLIRKFVDEDKIRKILDENKKRSGNKKKSKFQQRLEEAMKASQAKQKK